MTIGLLIAYSICFCDTNAMVQPAESNAAIRGWLTVLITDVTVQGDFCQTNYSSYCSLSLSMSKSYPADMTYSQIYCNRRFIYLFDLLDCFIIVIIGIIVIGGLGFLYKVLLGCVWGNTNDQKKAKKDRKHEISSKYRLHALQ